MKRILTLALTFCLLLTMASALAWETPVTGETSDWVYEDETRSIHINQVREGDVTYFVADVQLAGASGFQTAYGSGLKGVSQWAKAAGAVLAINGDDYGTHKYGVIVRNGELLRTHDTTRCMLAVDANGDMHVRTNRTNEDYRALGKELLGAGVRHTFEFGPELVRDGQAVAFNKEFNVISTKSSRREPRTAIGQIGKLHYILIVVDGRQSGYSAGISLQDLQQLFVRYGTQTAMNLDGGGSAEIWFQGEVLNRPAGGRERSVSDIIWF